jgi:intracellular multiplication protein IcmC
VQGGFVHKTNQKVWVVMAGVVAAMALSDPAWAVPCVGEDTPPGCTPEPAPPLSPDNLPDKITVLKALGNLAGSYPGLLNAFEAFIFVAGVFLAALAMFRFRDAELFKDARQRTTGLIYLIVSVVFLTAPTVISMVIVTLTGQDNCVQGKIATHFYDYMAEGGDCSSVDDVIRPVLLFVQFYGFFAFIRGWFLIIAAARQPQSGQGFSVKGIVHVVFGVLCIHIFDTLSILANTLGFTWLMKLIEPGAIS